jgi:hypothetical protein
MPNTRVFSARENKGYNRFECRSFARQESKALGNFYGLGDEYLMSPGQVPSYSKFGKPSWKVIQPLEITIGRVVEECAAKVGAESVDADVLDGLVDAATRVPHNETDRQHSPQPKRAPKLAATRGGPIRAHHPSPRLFSPYLSGTRAATRIAWETARSPEGLSCRRRWADGGRGDGFGTLARGREAGGGYL